MNEDQRGQLDSVQVHCPLPLADRVTVSAKPKTVTFGEVESAPALRKGGPCAFNSSSDPGDKIIHVRASILKSPRSPTRDSSPDAAAAAATSPKHRGSPAANTRVVADPQTSVPIQTGSSRSGGTWARPMNCDPSTTKDDWKKSAHSFMSDTCAVKIVSPPKPITVIPRDLTSRRTATIQKSVPLSAITDRNINNNSNNKLLTVNTASPLQKMNTESEGGRHGGGGGGGNYGGGRCDSGRDKPQQSVSPLCHSQELSHLKELKTKHKFSLAFDHQNQVAATAIKSLDSLNDQIVQYIFGGQGSSGHHDTVPPPPLLDIPVLGGPRSAEGHSEGVSQDKVNGNSLSPREQNNLHTSMVLIRRLLMDAQGKFRKMVEENKQLAVRIDGSIQSANHEVHALRAELADTNKRLSKISTSGEKEEEEEKGKDSKGVGGGGVKCGSSSSGVSGSSIINDGGGDSAGVDGGGGVTNGCGSGSGSSHPSPGGGTVTIRAGLKETDLDGCVGDLSGDDKTADDGGILRGGGGGGDENDGEVCPRTLSDNGEEKTDVNKEEVTSCRTESEACRDGGGEERRASSVGRGWQVTAEDAATPDPTTQHLIMRLREDNARMEHQLRSLCQEMTSLRGTGNGEGATDNHPSYGELRLELIQSRQELNRAKDALQAMKGDRKRLKAEKVELLHQMKQLYVTLEDKESELRDFIRNYEQRVQESDESIKQLALEKEESEREKWEIIKRAREAAERTVIIRTQLDAKEITIKELQEEVAKLKEQVAERGLDESRESNTATPTPADDDDKGHEAMVWGPSSSSSSSSAANTPAIVRCNALTTTTSSTPNTTSATSESGGSECGSCHTPEGYLSKDDSGSGGTPMSTPTFSNHGNDSLSSLMRWMALSNEGIMAGSGDGGDLKNAKKKKRSFGSLSRVFGRGRTRRSIALPHNESLFEEGSGTKLSLLATDNYQEKLQTVRAASGVPMAQWKAGQVLAWLETSLGMPMYGRSCALNIKSGKVLLGLSDSELGAALGITNHIHRRKLRLAIEEYRDPTSIKFPLAPRLDVTWVAHKLLPELGLPQYSHVFERNLVDGRLLNSLGRRDLEKHFDIHRKFHQASILHGVELLRRMEFDREKLAERRSQCEDSDTDLMVWTCSRLVNWVRSIDLGEFADHLQESGVHGALMVLEPSFTSDTLATALAIPPSKSYIRRHLTTELDTLLRPARAALDTPNNNSKHLDSGSKGHTFTRSYRGHGSDDGSKGRLSFRGSLGRAFGKKIRDDLKLAFDSDSPKWKISAPIPIQPTSSSPLPPPHRTPVQHSSLDNVVEIPGDSTPV